MGFPTNILASTPAARSAMASPLSKRLSNFPARPVAGRIIAGCIGMLLCWSAPAANLDDPVDLSRFGIFYERYEPTFYTGFAPRAKDPARLHLHVGRGNQLRITLVLSHQVLEDYASDLLARYQTYRRLIDDGRVKLTQNSGFETFEQTLKGEHLEDLVVAEADMPPADLRSRNLALMERLNPGRIFRIRMPVDELVRRWTSELRPGDLEFVGYERQLELLNLMLPTRLQVSKLDAAHSKALKDLIAKVPEGGNPDPVELSGPYLELLDSISHGIYPRNGDHLEFAELTAIHPVGTFNSYINHKGRKIPQYPTPGRRALDPSPTDQDRGPHPGRGCLQLLALDPVYACGQAHAQLLPHPLVAHEPR